MSSIRSIAPVFLAFAVVAACASPKKTVTVDNALLAHATPESREAIAASRAERDVARDEMAIRNAALERADDEVLMAKLALDTAKATAEQARLAADVAAKSGAPDDLKASGLAQVRTLALVDVAKEVLAVERAENALAEAEANYAKAMFELRDAQVEETKAIAVQNVDLVKVRDVRLEEFTEITAAKQRKVDQAGEAVQESLERLKLANEKLSQARAHADSVGADDGSRPRAEEGAAEMDSDG